MTSSSTIFEKLSNAANAKSLNVVSISDSKNTSQFYNWDVSPAYVVRVERLFKQYNVEYKVDLVESQSDQNLETFALWLSNARIKTLTNNTWKSYRSALNSVIINNDKFRAIIMNAKAPPASSLDRRGSRKRRKAVSNRQLTKMIGELSKSQSKYAADALRWIAVTLSVGLRPKEWLNANIMTKSGYPVLSVMNAKRTQNDFTDSQGILLRRNIPLWHLDEDEVNLIDEHISFMTTEFSNMVEFEQYYERLRGYINTVMNRSGATESGRSFGLYSCRQQFAANLKASDLNKKLKAYFMGHGDYKVMQNHYGATRAGKPILTLTPEQEGILLVLRESDMNQK
jgi:hypothetical protein